MQKAPFQKLIYKSYGELAKKNVKIVRNVNAMQKEIKFAMHHKFTMHKE
jgi:hypothetical protein